MSDPLCVEFATLKINLNTYNNILKNTIRLAKKIYYQTIFTKLKNDVRAAYKSTSEIISRTK